MQRSRARVFAADRRLERVDVPAPAVGRRGRHVDRDRPGGADRALEEEARGRDDDLVAGLDERPEADAERLHGAVRDEDPGVRVDRAARVVRASSARERLAQRGEAAGGRRLHRPPEGRRDGVDDVGRERRGRCAVQRHGLDPVRPGCLESLRRRVRREAAGTHEGMTGNTMRDG